MATVLLPLRWDNKEHSLLLPDRTLASISTLGVEDQVALEMALHELETITPDAPQHADLKRFLRDEPVYIFRATPEFRFFVRFEPGKRGEVIDLLSAETIWQTFNMPDPFGQYP